MNPAKRLALTKELARKSLQKQWTLLEEIGSEVHNPQLALMKQIALAKAGVYGEIINALDGDFVLLRISSGSPISEDF